MMNPTTPLELIAQSHLYLRRAAGKIKEPTLAAELERLAGQLQPLIVAVQNG